MLADFIEELRNLSSIIEKQKDLIQTEKAMKPPENQFAQTALNPYVY